MAASDTAAGRLHTILESIRHGNAQRSLREAWVTVLGLGPEPGSQLLVAVGHVVELADEVSMSVENLADVNNALLMRWEAPVRSALSAAHRLDDALSGFTSRYDDTALYALEVVADRVDRSAPSRHIGADDVTEALALVSALLDALEGVEDHQARALLIRHAVRLQAALRMVRVSGADGVAEALVDLAAAFAVSESATEGAGGKRAREAFVNVVAMLSTAMSMAANAYQLAPVIGKVLHAITS